MASLFASCPTFLLSQPPSSSSGKKRTHFTQGASRSGLCMTPVRHDARVGPRAGSHFGHFCPIRILCWDWAAVIGAEPDDAVDVASPQSECSKHNVKKKKIRHNMVSLLICEIGQCPTFHDSSYFIGWKFLLSRCVRLTFKLHFFFLYTLRLCFVTTPGDSYCLQVIGSAKRWSRIRNELTLGST